MKITRLVWTKGTDVEVHDRIANLECQGYTLTHTKETFLVFQKMDYQLESVITELERKVEKLEFKARKMLDAMITEKLDSTSVGKILGISTKAVEAYRND